LAPHRRRGNLCGPAAASPSPASGPGAPARTLWGGLDLDIRAGERIALVGPNGSGKTALLDTLAGWLEPTAGTLVRPPRETVGTIAQFPEYQLFAATVLEDVRFGIARRGGGRAAGEIDAAAFRALRQAGLDPARFAGRAPEALSLGERRRVALAGVLATQPLALLLDEPTAGSTPPGRTRCWPSWPRLRAGERPSWWQPMTPAWRSGWPPGRCVSELPDGAIPCRKPSPSRDTLNGVTFEIP
jgi:energy-coupling factor transporter ATP-binding protein EcfA2